MRSLQTYDENVVLTVSNDPQVATKHHADSNEYTLFIVRAKMYEPKYQTILDELPFEVELNCGQIISIKATQGRSSNDTTFNPNETVLFVIGENPNNTLKQGRSSIEFAFNPIKIKPLAKSKAN